MCLSCGCKQPNEKHGNDANITMNDVEAAAKAGEVSTLEAAQNIYDGVREFGKQTAGAGQKTSS